MHTYIIYVWVFWDLSMGVLVLVYLLRPSSGIWDRYVGQDEYICIISSLILEIGKRQAVMRFSLPYEDDERDH